MHAVHLALIVASSLLVSVTANYQNVNGKELEKCSGPGMALTGDFNYSSACTCFEIETKYTAHMCLM